MFVIRIIAWQWHLIRALERGTVILEMRDEAIAPYDKHR